MRFTKAFRAVAHWNFSAEIHWGIQCWDSLKNSVLRFAEAISDETHWGIECWDSLMHSVLRLTEGFSAEIYWDIQCWESLRHLVLRHTETFSALTNWIMQFWDSLRYRIHCCHMWIAPWLSNFDLKLSTDYQCIRKMLWKKMEQIIHLSWAELDKALWEMLRLGCFGN